jgi:adenosine deaminase
VALAPPPTRIDNPAMPAALSLEFIEKLPKTDLHCHLDGSLRLDTILDLARRQGVTLPTTDRDGLFHLLYAGERAQLARRVPAAFDITLSGAADRGGARAGRLRARRGRLARERALPRGPLLAALHTRLGLRPAVVVEAVMRGLRAAKRQLGIRYGVILCAIRSLPADQSLRIAELCVAFKNRGVVGFDLAGSEVNNPAKLHRQAFQLVIDNNINCTAHAGESFGPDSVHQAIHKCGAHRIGHGVRLIESGELLNYVNDHRIPIEVCPSSNVQTKAAASWETHPVDFFVDYGLRVTINTDNRLMTDTTVSKELFSCATSTTAGRSRRSRRSSSRASRARSCRTARRRPHGADLAEIGDGRRAVAAEPDHRRGRGGPTAFEADVVAGDRPGVGQRRGPGRVVDRIGRGGGVEGDLGLEAVVLEDGPGGQLDPRQRRVTVLGGARAGHEGGEGGEPDGPSSHGAVVT